MSENTTNVLLIEDNPIDILLIRELLNKRQSKYSIVSVSCLKDGIAYLQKEQPDVILLDLYLPDSQGIQTFDTLFAQMLDIPIIVSTALEDENTALLAVNNGAQDYLLKGNNTSALLSRSIKYAIERKKSENKIKYLALYDTLTDLPNRRLFFDRLSQAFSRAHRYSSKVGLMFIDLNKFKQINDTYGHEMGDLVLQTVGTRLKYAIRETDTAARLGGDEFAIILQDIHNESDTNAIARKIINTLKEDIHAKKIPFKLAQVLV
ncbi:MAG: signal transduction response regulator, receiver and diguanylate cyclase domain [Candidatus Magnetoglobus multicellularis str. Araruama]|uniref:Signal transduction response regulator, receiver and diguanylate cyclase domain n=1 Tax=Candidatus Magnetoglobus multicellularis str. Araruama TaxID=890399 RepID=A0A1V1P7N1_9BACT|nr:MAG: signal transduction response regulator, receiver and diguanylate cyclase domain [Candidatus Magnetoglobus multicellularis str. Araruama]